MSNQHTPGEWEAKGRYVFASNNCIGICDTDNDTETRMKANARVMAAAPDFKKAAEDMCAALSRFGDWEDGCFYYNGTSAPELQAPFQALADAIAKAEGSVS